MSLSWKIWLILFNIFFLEMLFIYFLLFCLHFSLHNCVHTNFWLNSIISEYANSEIVDDLKLKTSFGLSSKLFCSGKGQFLDGKCECFKGNTGDKCQVYCICKHFIFFDVYFIYLELFSIWRFLVKYYITFEILIKVLKI